MTLDELAAGMEFTAADGQRLTLLEPGDFIYAKNGSRQAIDNSRKNKWWVLSEGGATKQLWCFDGADLSRWPTLKDG